MDANRRASLDAFGPLTYDDRRAARSTDLREKREPDRAVAGIHLLGVEELACGFSGWIALSKLRPQAASARCRGFAVERALEGEHGRT
jgi:hypothetical protein